MRFLFLDQKIINILLKEEKPSGGAAVQSYGWTRGLSENGHDVYIMTNLDIKGQLKEEAYELNLIPFFEESKGIRWLRWLYYRLPFMYRKIKVTRPDYVYQSVPGWTCLLVGMICKKLNIKYILRISNDFFLDDRFHHFNSKAHAYFMKKGIQLTDYILCQNDYQYSMIQKKFPEKSIFKISNPILFQSNGTKPYALEERKYIAWLGIFQYQKNLKLLYEIASKLPDEEFWVAGKESSTLDDNTRLYLKKLKVLPNVTFKGFISRKEVPTFLKNAKYLLNTSHYEGFSNTFLEAMTVGTPILTTEKVNPDGIIDSNQLGIVYRNSLHLAKTLKGIGTEDYMLMSQNTVRYVTENHNYKILAEKLTQFLMHQ
ncbi:hypothetical protein GCM10028791_37550 [Echinicola sediminis]